MIVDMHCHIGDYPEVKQSVSADELVAMGDPLGVKISLISMLSKNVPAANDAAREACERFPGRLYGYIYLNPADAQGSLAELERCSTFRVSGV